MTNTKHQDKRVRLSEPADRFRFITRQAERYEETFRDLCAIFCVQQTEEIHARARAYRAQWQ
jgi:hypothetical protein